MYVYITYNEKKPRKIPMISDIENWALLFLRTPLKPHPSKRAPSKNAPL